MPSRTFRISGTPRVNFSKQLGKLEPVLNLVDIIKVRPLPTEVVEPGQIAVTFLPAVERAVTQVGQTGNIQILATSQNLKIVLNYQG